MRMALLLISLFVSTGCASIVRGNESVVTFQSKPAGADLQIRKPNGRTVFEGKAPASVRLSTYGGFFRPASYVILADLDGHRGQKSTIKAEIDGLYFGNILFGGLLGMVLVDPSTGAMWSFDAVHVSRLERIGPKPEPRSAPAAESDQMPFEECFDFCANLVSQTEEQCIGFCGGD